MVPVNDIQTPIEGMSIEQLKASFLMQLQEIEMAKHSFIHTPISTLTQDQVNIYYSNIIVLYNNLDLTADRIDYLEIPNAT